MTLFLELFISVKTTKENALSNYPVNQRDGSKGIDMSLSYNEVYIETIFAIIEMSRDKLCSHGLLVLVNVRCSCCCFTE